MNRYEAARALSIADADVLSLRETEHGVEVACRDGSVRLIAPDGMYALSDHPATRSWRRFEPAPVRTPKPPARARAAKKPPAKAQTRKTPKKS